MDEKPIRADGPGRSVVQKFLRRIFWSYEAGPVTAEGRVEIRELDTDPDPTPEQEPDEPPPVRDAT